MRFNRLTGWFVALFAAAGLLLGVQTAVQAHPHAWIDIRVKVLFDDKGRVYALAQEWIFDPMYTAFALEGLSEKGAPPDPKKVAAVTQENLKNMRDYDYLTEVETKSGKAKFAGVRDVGSAVKKGRLTMSFTLTLDAPLDAAGQPVTYSIYDPTFYIEILHAEGGGAIELVEAPAGCRHELRVPKPNPEMVAFAAALDRTQSAGDGLGKFFAERVAVECAAQP